MALHLRVLRRQFASPLRALFACVVGDVLVLTLALLFSVLLGFAGKAYFWDLTTLRLETTFDAGYPVPMCDVSWHPTQQVCLRTPVCG
jgi:hypothetical protein